MLTLKDLLKVVLGIQKPPKSVGPKNNALVFLDAEYKKPCVCGKRFKSRPSNAKLFEDIGFKGYYWDCKCGATLCADSKAVWL
jgi:hypothetical protein